MNVRRRRAVGLVAQLIALGGVTYFLVYSARAHWATVGVARLEPAWWPLALGSALTVAAYLFLVRAWVTSLRWWGERPRYLAALRVWFVSNLARYAPGGVWQFAGLAALSVEQGMSPVAATAAVLLQQAVLLATGVALGLALAPRMLGAWTAAFPAGLLLTFAAALVLGVALLLPPALPALERILTRLVRRPVPWPTPPARQFAVYVLALALPWLAYGLAFWLFARSLLGAGAPGPLFCLAAFTASYVAGIVAVFAPGGIVVREAALVAALAPRVGAQNALLLAFGSRLWLVALEVVTALAIVALWRLARPASQP